MSVTTIQIPADHVAAIRASLIGRRDEGYCVDAIDGLLGQLPSGDRSASQHCALTGSRALLWSAVYDSLCAAAEQLAEDCNEYWRGTVTPDSARAGIAVVGTRLELLVGLGPPPGR